MVRATLLRLLPLAPAALLGILNHARGPVQAPIRSEIFGPQRFAQHGRSLGDTHRAAPRRQGGTPFFPRIKSNMVALREAHRYIGEQASTGYDISPAAEWLLDNFHLIEAQLKEINDGLPSQFFAALPMLLDEPLAGLPRIYGVAWAFVAHTDGAFDESLLSHFLTAYEEVRELNLSEMWALPTTLRVVMIENLRRLAERIATHKAAREVANLCIDQIDTITVAALTELLGLLSARGVGQVFLVQLALRLQDRRIARLGEDLGELQHWLDQALPDLAALQTQQEANQAADNLSVSNAITSLRAIGDADWPELIAHTSILMRLMRTSPVFEAEDTLTRDQSLHAIERLAQRSALTEVAVAQQLLKLMGEAYRPLQASAVPTHWLHGAGRPELLRALGLGGQQARLRLFITRRLVLPLYLGTLLLALVGVVAWLVNRSPDATSALWPWVAVLALFPASEAVVAVINRLISESTPPHHLPRLALTGGITAEQRVMVVIPAMLTGQASATDLVHRLHLHYLANPEPQAQFALLTDWADAPTARTALDASNLSHALALLDALNTRHPVDQADPSGLMAPRFIVLHRTRQFSPTEQCWLGWERKRGKLEQLMTALATGTQGAFIDLGEASRMAHHVVFVMTLDSDTQLPPGRLRELVGVAAHPHNLPVLNATGRTVDSGYAIFQPRVATPLPAVQAFTLYHWLFAGQCGIDPYSAASSEVYQDLFAEGTFTGKGLLHVHAMHSVLSGRLPESQVLSHDLLEGALARCASVSDIAVIEEAPFHADVAAARVHRWTRGDWQLLPFFLHPIRHGLSAIHLWKMADNLRRSLVAPMSLGLLLLSLLGALSPGTALGLVLVAFAGGPLMGAIAGLSPSRDDIAKRHFYREAAIDLARAIWGGVWLLAQLLQQSLFNLDAIDRALYRMTVSRRHLLQWTTADTAQRHAKHTLWAITRQHWREPALAGVLWVGLLLAATPSPWWAAGLCLLWGASPVWTWWVSRTCPACPEAQLPQTEQDHLRGIARDTWRLFERCVGPEDHHLPPDNLQTLPHDMVAHRTSPTNIGMYLLSATCARQFGWIGTQELLSRLEATLATLLTLTRHRGHFMNWYDTQTCAPMLPMYVSTVDSGNLSAHLLSVAQACLELAQHPDEGKACEQALAHASQRLAPGLARRGQLSGAARGELQWLLADHRATKHSARQDTLARAKTHVSGTDLTTPRLLALAKAFKDLAWQAEFGFLYSHKRHLLHIGYRVAEHQRDAGFYDLLASESRLTSLLGIARGDLPVRHWAHLGRAFFAVGADAGLRSWTGSMFEYLMPSLVLTEPRGSVLFAACHAALREHMVFAQALGVPWGISESAYAASDHTLAYQYAPQGVPRLALRRTPPDELVVAPYATALAAQIAPHTAVLNYMALEKLGVRGRYGFVEALDYTATRRTGLEPFVPVSTFMAHHQGMTIVALANVLMGGVAQRWGMANAHVQAVSSLLHERVPREVAHLPDLPARLSPPTQRRRTTGLLREVPPGSNAVEPTHLLSNGRYSVLLRANGAGASRWEHTGLTRTRDDALRDDRGSFFYLRLGELAPLVSLTQHPAPDPAAHYSSVFHGDRVCFDTDWPQLQAHTTVWVSPEDDVEFRQVVLHNLGDTPLKLELISAFDVTLTDARADEAHPAFTNLFVSAEWLASHQTLWLARQPRLPTETGLKMAHFLTDTSTPVTRVRLTSDRQRWLGRNRNASQPLGQLMDAPEHSGVLDTGLDPVCVLAVTVEVAPGAKARLTFATAAASNADTLRAVVDKYRQASHVQRASLMSATLTGIRLRALRIGVDNFSAIQLLTSALVLGHSRPQVRNLRQADPAIDVCDRRLLWRFEVSGDRPILLVLASVPQGMGLLRALAQAMGLWLWGNVACDLVVINAEPASYLMPLDHDITALLNRHNADCSAKPFPSVTRMHLLRADNLSAQELSTLHSLACVVLHADGRPLTHHVQEWLQAHEWALSQRQDTATTALTRGRLPQDAPRASQGTFAAQDAAFSFDVTPTQRPARPWVNVLANPDFGAQLSEAGGGHSWAVNSRLNQITAGANDPVGDPCSEWFLLQNRKTQDLWPLTPAQGTSDLPPYRVTHSQGVSTLSHHRGGLTVVASWCVDTHSAVKHIHIHLVNQGQKTLHLRAIGLAEWMMGANRSDRFTVRTSLWQTPTLTALLCTQRERASGFGEGTAYLALGHTSGNAPDWTCDRRESFDARGQLVVPDVYDQHSGDGLDPCAALAAHLTLPAGGSTDITFLLGHAASPELARQQLAQAALKPAAQRQAEVQAQWNQLLGATTVATPDPLFDALVNRWLLYQSVSCRLWAKAGFYQAGGATGFRDQLQDTMALAWAAPHMLRAQIVLHASRQFVPGDVQHWWHAPTGVGVRTHFSDDLLWLAHATSHYLATTGDASVLDEQVPFLDGAAIAEGAEDAYFAPTLSAQSATVFEHAARAIDRSLGVGAHGLPLMGTGDWNDGMNRVGAQGRGESVWLGWFLCTLIGAFAPLARSRGEAARAQAWEHAASQLQTALTGTAWDGQWFTRAYFDDGQPLGTAANPEARIDLIAQAWSVLSQAAPLTQQRQAMAALDAQLVDPEAGLIRLLTPPLVHAQPSAGYIQAYPPGVRENGGQYTHAGAWALMAVAELARHSPNDPSHTAGDTAYRYFKHLSPAHRASHPTQGLVYGLEPYVVAGDVCSHPPYTGRGGWSWYTGAAAWLHRAAIESMFGLTQRAQTLSLSPCLPSHWQRAELTLVRDARRMRFIVWQGTLEAALAATADLQAQPLLPGQPLAWQALAQDTCFVVPLVCQRTDAAPSHF